MVSEISSHSPDHRIIKLIDYLKKNDNNQYGQFEFEVKLTRQEIADLTGLRVETVIRAIKKLETLNVLSIKNRKVYR